MDQTPAEYVRGGAPGIDYTPGQAVCAGQIVVVGSRVGIAKADIALGALGILYTTGQFRVPKAQEAFTDGVKVYWDENGNPYGGTGLSGAATQTPTENVLMGRAIGSAGPTASFVTIALESPVNDTAT